MKHQRGLSIYFCASIYDSQDSALTSTQQQLALLQTDSLTFRKKPLFPQRSQERTTRQAFSWRSPDAYGPSSINAFFKHFSRREISASPLTSVVLKHQQPYISCCGRYMYVCPSPDRESKVQFPVSFLPFSSLLRVSTSEFLKSPFLSAQQRD